MMVTCPEGATVGTFLCVTSPAGQQMQVAVPLNVNPGDVFQVVLTAAAPRATVVIQMPQASPLHSNQSKVDYSVSYMPVSS